MVNLKCLLLLLLLVMPLRRKSITCECIVYRNCVFLVSKMRLSYVCLICSCVPIRCWCRCYCCCCRFCSPRVWEYFVHFFFIAFWYTSKTITTPAKHRQRNVCLMHWQKHKHNTRVKHTYTEKKKTERKRERGSKRGRDWTKVNSENYIWCIQCDCLMRMCFRSQCYQFVIEGQS